LIETESFKHVFAICHLTLQVNLHCRVTTAWTVTWHLSRSLGAQQECTVQMMLGAGNLLVEADWTVRVADFGLSRVMADINTMVRHL